MIPKLTQEAVALLPIESGRAELLEEIMSTPVMQSPAPETVRSSRRTRWVVPLAVAAAVATVASTPLWWGGPDAQHSPGTSFQAAPDSPGTGYRAVLSAAGWTVESTEEDDKYGGEIDYSKGAQQLQITWYPDKTYDGYLLDRQHISDPDVADPGEAVQMLGAPGHLWAYDQQDHTVMREPRDGHWMEFRGSGMDQAAFQALLGQLRLVSLAEFESALPSSFVTADDRPEAVQKILDGIEGVSGATVPAGTTLNTKSDEQDPYQLGAGIAGQYACAWIAEFADAKTSGDQARATEAARVMGTSRQWPVLQQMNPKGDYPEVVWEYADTIAGGQVPEGYVQGLGCS